MVNERMRKEIVFAIVFGGILGLIVAFGIWRVNSALSPKDRKEEAAASPTPRPEFLISLAKPENYDVVITAPLELSGITKPNSLVAVSGEEDDYLTETDGEGVFNESVALVGGTNEILLTAFDEAGTPTNTRVLVVYSSEFEKIIENASSGPTAEEADSVRERVERKVEQALNKPQAYLGLVADISEETIQIKNPDGEIQQVQTTEDTVFVKTNGASKTVNFKDVAIGDFVIAMGYRNGNAVLNAKRVLVTPPFEKSKREILYAKATKTTNKDFSVAASDGQELTVVPAKGAVYLAKVDGKITKAKFADLEEGAQVVTFGERGGDSFSARTVFIVTQ